MNHKLNELNMKTTLTGKDRTAIPTEYVFANAGDRAKTQFLELSRLYDAQTIRHIEQRGIDEGWSCLEVGGGGGSIASWLCVRVGATGRVLATDIDPRFLHTLSFPNLEARHHDIRSEPLPAHEFDLVHARLVLTHLPERESALERMVAALKPGGWIVIEEMDDLTLLPDPAVYPGEVSLKVKGAFQQVLNARGVDLRYGRSMPQKLRAHGLQNIGAEATASIWKAGSAGARLVKFSCEELREAIIGAGHLSQAEFEADMARLAERDFLMPSPMLWTAWGQLP